MGKSCVLKPVLGVRSGESYQPRLRGSHVPSHIQGSAEARRELCRQHFRAGDDLWRRTMPLAKLAALERGRTKPASRELLLGALCRKFMVRQSLRTEVLRV